MALLPQNERDKKFLVVALLFVVVAVVYQQYVWSPKQVELDAVATHLDALDSLNRLAKLDVAKGNASKMRAEAEMYAKELDVMRRLVPTENEVPALLEAVSSAARRVGLEISDVAPDGIVNGDHFDTYRYKIGVTGPYHEVAEFLSNVGSLQRIVAPINLSIAPTARIGERKPKAREQFLDAKIGIQTYVAHVAPRQPVAATGAGAP